MKKVLVGAAVLLAGVVMTACYQGNLAGPRVAEVGDSISWYSQPEIETAFQQAGFAYQVAAVPGKNMTEMFRALQAQLADPMGAPQAEIVELGANDANELFPTATWQTELYREMDALKNTPCVILVNLHEPVPDPPYVEGANAIAVQINYGYWLETQVHPNVHLLDWDAATAAHPEYIISDLLHPSLVGRAALADLMVQALHQDCQL